MDWGGRKAPYGVQNTDLGFQTTKISIFFIWPKLAKLNKKKKKNGAQMGQIKSRREGKLWLTNQIKSNQIKSRRVYRKVVVDTWWQMSRGHSCLSHYLLKTIKCSFSKCLKILKNVNLISFGTSLLPMYFLQEILLI